MSGFFEEGAERLELLLRVEVPGVEGVVRVRQRDFEFVLLLVEFRAFDLRDEQRLLRHRALAHDGEGHPVAVYGDSASGGGQRAGLPDFEQRAEEQYGASRDEEDRDGRRSEDPHAADADAERGDEREDDHHEGDAEVRQFAREGAGRGVVEGSHGVFRCVFRFGLCLRVQI